MDTMSNTAISNKHIKTYVNEVNEFISRKTKELENKLMVRNSNIDTIMEFLAEEVCKIYNIKTVDLKRTRASSLSVDAQDIMINLMREYTPFTAKEIVFYLGKKNANDRCFIAKKKHENIDIRIPADKFYQNTFKEVEQKFVQFLGIKTD